MAKHKDQYAKALQRLFWHHVIYLLMRYTKMVLSIDMKSINFCQHDLMMMQFDFGENSTNGLGVVQKSRF